MASKEYRARKKALGLCTECSNPAEVGRTRCLSCIKLHNLANIKTKAKYRSQGMCECGREKLPNHYKCANCTEVGRLANIRSRIKRKDNNKCTRCGKPLMERTDITKCINCNEGALASPWH
jgi:DNA-directed RNA polymerase subunit RPC12/RpoP